MSLVSNIDVEFSATIGIDQGGVSDGRCKSMSRFIGNVGSLMARGIIIVFCAVLGLTPSKRG